MWVGAFSLSLAVLPIGVSVLFDAVKTLRSYHDYDVLGVISLWVVSFLLVTWCDAALVIEAVGMGRERRAVAQPHSPPAGRWLMWVAALGLSLWLLPGSVLGVLSYRRHGRLDILLFSVVSGFVVTLFDVALLIDAFKMWRAQRTGKTKAVPSCSSGDSPTESE
jgi:hypothetical protein